MLILIIIKNNNIFNNNNRDNNNNIKNLHVKIFMKYLYIMSRYITYGVVMYI